MPAGCCAEQHQNSIWWQKHIIYSVPTVRMWKIPSESSHVQWICICECAGASHFRGAMERLEITQQTINVLKSNLQREWEQSVRIRSVQTGYDHLILSVQDTANVDDCSSAMSLSQFQQIAHLQVSTPCENMDYALRWADAQLAVMKNGVASELMHN